MKTARKTLLLGLALSLAIASGAPAQEFSKYYALGDSLTAGVVSWGSVEKYQKNSVPALIARQVGGPSPFQQPLVSEPGLPPLMELKAIRMTPFGVSPVIAFKSGAGSPLNATLAGPYNNLGIDGANTNDLLTLKGNILNLGADMVKYAQGLVGKNVPFADLVLRDGKTTAIQQAIGAKGTFYTVAIGSNEAFGAVLTALVIDGVTMTPLATFSAQYDTLIGTLRSQRPGADIFVATLWEDPIPFTTAVKPYLTVVATGQKIPLIGEAGLINDNDFLTLQASALIAQGIGIPKAAGGTGLPLPEGSIDATGLHAGVIIRAAEMATLIQRSRDMNAVIRATATKYNARVVDLATPYHTWNTTGVVIGGIRITNAFLTGGITSYDGAHLTQIGYALTANEWIKAINTAFGVSYPVVDIRPLMLTAQAATTVQAASFMLDPETGIRMIKSYVPNALTDKLTVGRAVRNRGPVVRLNRPGKPEVN